MRQHLPNIPFPVSGRRRVQRGLLNQAAELGVQAVQNSNQHIGSNGGRLVVHGRLSLYK
jgi:hypothetical protein